VFTFDNSFLGRHVAIIPIRLGVKLLFLHAHHGGRSYSLKLYRAIFWQQRCLRLLTSVVQLRVDELFCWDCRLPHSLRRSCSWSSSHIAVFNFNIFDWLSRWSSRWLRRWIRSNSSILVWFPVFEAKLCLLHFSYILGSIFIEHCFEMLTFEKGTKILCTLWHVSGTVEVLGLKVGQQILGKDFGVRHSMNVSLPTRVFQHCKTLLTWLLVMLIHFIFI
jgi:hypothetical protein